MGSPELLQQQLQRFIKNKKTTQLVINTGLINKEILKLKEQQKRYTKAYAEGLLSMEQLKEYIMPIDANINTRQQQIDNTTNEEQQKDILPTEKNIKMFAQKAIQQLQSLDFTTKKEIVKNVVDTVRANKERLIISGYIPVNNSAVLCSDYRDNPNTIQTKNSLLFIDNNSDNAVIPFQITIDMKQNEVLKKAA